MLSKNWGLHGFVPEFAKKNNFWKKQMFNLAVWAFSLPISSVVSQDYFFVWSEVSPVIFGNGATV